MSQKQSKASTGRHELAVVADFIRNNLFILSVLLAAMMLYAILFPHETATPDGSNYMLLGKQMTQGSYGFSFMHRLPLIPSVFAAMYMAGFSVAQIGFVVPLLFLLLSLAAAYLLSREIAGERAAMLSTVLLFSFPEFWRWGLKFLTDIPVLALSALSFYFFLRGRKDEVFFVPMALCISAGLMAKLSFFIVPLVIFSYMALFNRKALFRRNFMICMAIPLIVLISAFFVVSASRQADDLSLIWSMVDANTTSERHMTAILQLVTGNYGDIAYFANLALFPLLVFVPFGVAEAAKRRRHFLLFSATAIFLFFFLFSYVRLRYYSPIYPIITILASLGFLHLRGMFSGRSRDAVSVIFAVLLVVSFVDTLYLSSLDFGMQWGTETLSKETSMLDGLIISDYLPYHLNLTADVVTNATISGKFFSDGTPEVSGLKRLGVKYVVLSIYGEFSRSPSNDTYHPYFGPFEVTFVQRPYTGDRPPPGYTFRSELYRRIESDPSFEKISEIYHDGQKKFIIYRAGG